MRHSLLSAALLLGLASQAQALTDTVINAGLQLNFSNPGARSLGMGGAFLGFSDDATAAYTNPAGLTNLATPEIAYEWRSNSNSIPYVSGGSASVAPDDFSDLEFSDAEATTRGTRFFSYVQPFEHFTLAVYRHTTAEYDNLLGQGPVFVDSANEDLLADVFEQGASIQLSLINYGASVAFKVGDKLSVGAGLVYSSFDFIGVTVRTPGRGQIELQRGDDHALEYNLGLLYQLDDKWSIGAAYRRGGDYDISYANLNSLSNAVIGAGETSFDVPHQIGIGVAYRPTDQLSIGFEANHVKYSRLGNGFDSTAFTVPGSPAGFTITADDGTELRLGGEYVFANMSRPFSVRAGIWRDPDHRLAYDGPRPPADFGQAAAFVLFPEGYDEYHYSLGLGWAFESFQLDAAADFSDLVDTYSLSGVWRF